MGPGLHKLLTHVPHLQALLDYPISWSAEEAIESAHKLMRKIVTNNVFVGSPESVMLSLLRLMLVRSDPCIATLFHFPKSRMSHQELPSRVKELLHMDSLTPDP